MENWQQKYAEELGAATWDQVRPKLCVVLCNAERNRKYLEDRVHKIFLDLAIVPKILCGKDSTEYYWATMQKTAVDELGVSENEIIDAALKNSPILMPPAILDMSWDRGDVKSEIYVITNTQYVNGAAAIFYPGVLEGLRKQLNADLYLLPSSIHEFIVVPIRDSAVDAAEYAQIIQDANKIPDIVAEDDILGDHPYLYNGLGIQPA